MQSEPPAAGREGEDKHVCLPGVEGALCRMSLEKKDVGIFERIYIGQIGELEKETWGIVRKKVLDASGLVVGNSLVSSCVTRMRWLLVVSCSL